jgi:hypothetical protein
MKRGGYKKLKTNQKEMFYKQAHKTTPLQGLCCSENEEMRKNKNCSYDHLRYGSDLRLKWDEN